MSSRHWINFLCRSSHGPTSQSLIASLLGNGGKGNCRLGNVFISDFLTPPLCTMYLPFAMAVEFRLQLGLLVRQSCLSMIPFLIVILFVYVSAHTCVPLHVCGCHQRPSEGTSSPGAGAKLVWVLRT